METITKTEFDHVCTLHGRTLELTILLQIKGYVHPKKKILSLSTRLHIIKKKKSEGGSKVSKKILELHSKTAC